MKNGKLSSSARQMRQETNANFPNLTKGDFCTSTLDNARPNWSGLAQAYYEALFGTLYAAKLWCILVLVKFNHYFNDL